MLRMIEQESTAAFADRRPAADHCAGRRRSSPAEGRACRCAGPLRERARSGGLAQAGQGRAGARHAAEARTAAVRRGAAAPGAREPRRERAQVLPGRRARRRSRRRRARSRAHRGARPGARHPAVGAAARLREVLPLDPEMARGIGGSGLGLYISRKIVEQMDGLSSRVHSARASGSTFTVYSSRKTGICAYPRGSVQTSLAG